MTEHWWQRFQIFRSYFNNAACDMDNTEEQDTEEDI